MLRDTGTATSTCEASSAKNNCSNLREINKETKIVIDNGMMDKAYFGREIVGRQRDVLSW